MAFNSLTFIVFLAIVLGLNRLPVSWRGRKTMLLLASYLFYAAWNPPFVVLLWISTGVDWFVASAMYRSRGPARRRALLLVSLCTNLGLLGFFKYGTFVLDTFVRALGTIGIHYQPAVPDIILPVGISFYTFQTLSYTIDVYRGQMRPWNSFLDFALFVTFFPQLVAGPIVRASQFLPQCTEERRATATQYGWGAVLLVFGLFQKVVLADSLVAPVADLVYADAADAGFLDAWIGTLAFSAQIFFDFAGYSTCAIGVALMLGFVIPDNFRYPYAAIGFSDFWRRWHISLSTWLRDYLYIPLGGNRGSASRVRWNLMITMLLGGLWHGAAWRFVFWGGLHGLYLVIERIVRARWTDPPALWHRTSTRIGLALLTYAAVCVTWVFFRATDFGSAMAIVTAMFGFAEGNLIIGRWHVLGVLLVTVGLLVGHWRMRSSSLEERWNAMHSVTRVLLVAGMLVAVIMSRGDDRAFIYFQF